MYDEEMPPIQKHTTTYEDLRKKNREEYQQRRTLSYREPVKTPQSAPVAPSIDGSRNKYGDVME